jgi:hypothetical protein
MTTSEFSNRTRLRHCVTFGIVVLLTHLETNSASAQETRDPVGAIRQNEALSQFGQESTYPDQFSPPSPPVESIYQHRSPRNWFDGRNSPGPKTLLSWNGAEVADSEPNPKLVTDRPHFSEASSLVGLGRVQIETGYTFTMDRSNGVRTTTQSFGEPLLRAGLGAEWFEFRLATTALTETTTGNGSRSTSGMDDLYLGAKIAITEQAGMLPEFAVFPQMRLPAGSPAFTSDRVLPGVNLAYSWMLNDWLELECNTQFNSRRDDLAHTYTEFIQTVNFEYELTDNVGAFTEVIGFMPSGSLSALPEYYFHGGFVYFLTDDIQFDIHSGVGLNRAATNLAFTGIGFSKRF